jgi:hypothetical protein
MAEEEFPEEERNELNEDIGELNIVGNEFNDAQTSGDATLVKELEQKLADAQNKVFDTISRGVGAELTGEQATTLLVEKLQGDLTNPNKIPLSTAEEDFLTKMNGFIDDSKGSAIAKKFISDAAETFAKEKGIDPKTGEITLSESNIKDISDEIKKNMDKTNMSEESKTSMSERIWKALKFLASLGAAIAVGYLAWKVFEFFKSALCEISKSESGCYGIDASTGNSQKCNDSTTKYCVGCTGNVDTTTANVYQSCKSCLTNQGISGTPTVSCKSIADVIGGLVQDLANLPQEILSWLEKNGKIIALILGLVVGGVLLIVIFYYLIKHILMGGSSEKSVRD